MPELPEVEAVRTGLSQLIIGKTISDVRVLWPRIIEQPEVDTFKLDLIGETFTAINRRGKFLILETTHYDLVSHLRMEGKYEFHQQTDELAKHTHVLFDFTDGTQLRYLDVRKFGRMSLLPKGLAEEYAGIKKLGPEPVLPDFDLTAFQKGLWQTGRGIKPVLLDQKLVTGLGNIYVDEALFESQIHPEQPANTLTKQEIKILHEAIIGVLGRAVEAGGTTIRTYKNALGEAGNFQVELNVYGQTNHACVRCGTPINKIVVGQRGTHYCPKCQVVRQRKAKG